MTLSSDTSNEVVYSINDIEQLSGIKAHTIRIWEQRYGIIQPARSHNNIRYYTDKDLQLILNIALLNKNGIKISKIAKMKTNEIQRQVIEIAANTANQTEKIDILTLSMIELDEYKFDKIISTKIQQIGFERTMLEVIYPFLDKLSLLWLTGSIKPVQENFICYLIRQKLIVAIDSEYLVCKNDAKKFLLYLPEGSNQELSLLFVHYLIKIRKHRVIYIGNTVKISDLHDIAQIQQPDYIYTILTENFAQMPLTEYVDALGTIFPNTHLLLSSYHPATPAISPKKNVQLLENLEETISVLNEILDIGY